MSSFHGWTAEHYLAYRRDVPDAVVVQLVEHFGLRAGDCVLDLGAGTGQLLIPLARLLGKGIGLVAVLAGAEELPTLEPFARGHVSLVAAANALHWMDAEGVFQNAMRVLRPGGGIAIVSHGLPLWLADTDWARAVDDYLRQRLGLKGGGMCGLDDETRHSRRELLLQVGFEAVTELRHHYRVPLTPSYIVGHLYSALSEEHVPADERDDFERSLLRVLDDYDPTSLVEDVPVVTLAATAPR